MNYYISDLHLGHKNILKFCNRPFKDVMDMKNQIISNWNSVVTDNDDVYILGDMFYGKKEDFETIIKSLKGRKHLILGNHDQWIEKRPALRKLFVEVTEYKIINDNGRKVVLFHYPMAEWNHKFYGSYHLYGHVHINELAYMKSLENCFNVSADVIGFTPRPLDYLIAS